MVIAILAALPPPTLSECRHRSLAGDALKASSGNLLQISDEEYGQIYVPFVNWAVLPYSFSISLATLGA